MDGTRDYQQMAVAILAIATAALGFGLWSQDFAPPETGGALLPYVRQGLGVIATIFYFGTFIAVGWVLRRKGPVTGQDLVIYPVLWLYLQVLALALLFFVGYFADITATGPGGPAGMPNEPLSD